MRGWLSLNRQQSLLSASLPVAVVAEIWNPVALNVIIEKQPERKAQVEAALGVHVADASCIPGLVGLRVQSGLLEAWTLTC